MTIIQKLYNNTIDKIDNNILKTIVTEVSAVSCGLLFVFIIVHWLQLLGHGLLGISIIFPLERLVNMYLGLTIVTSTFFLLVDFVLLDE